MKPATGDNHWLTRPTTVRRLWQLAAAVLLLTVVGQFLLPARGSFAADGWPGFGAVFGFVSCTALVLVAKLLGVVLKRDEAYYADETDDA